MATNDSNDTAASAPPGADGEGITEGPTTGGAGWSTGDQTSAMMLQVILLVIWMLYFIPIVKKIFSSKKNRKGYSLRTSLARKIEN